MVREQGGGEGREAVGGGGEGVELGERGVSWWFGMEGFRGEEGGRKGRGEVR